MNVLKRKILQLVKGNDIKSRLVRGATGVGLLKILSMPLGVAASVIVARYLGPEGYGKYSFVMTVMTVMSLPIGSGIKQLTTREIASYYDSNNWPFFKGLLYRSHQWVTAISLLCILVIGYFSFDYSRLGLKSSWELQFIAILILPFLGFEAIRTGTLRGLNHVITAQIPEFLVRPGSHLIIVIILLTSGLLTPTSTLFSQLFAAVCAFGVGAYLLRQRMPQGKLNNVKLKYQNKEWFYAWLPFTLLMAANLFNNQLGILLLGWFGTDVQIGAFKVASKGAQFVSFPLVIVNMVISPYITKYFRRGDNKKLQDLSKKSARAALLLSIPVAFPLIFFGAPIVELVFGSEYVAKTVSPLAILTIGQLVSVFFGSVGLFLTMSGYERDTLFGQVTAVIINAILGFFLIPIIGATGAALATSAGMVIWNVIMAIKFYQRLNLTPSVW